MNDKSLGRSVAAPPGGLTGSAEGSAFERPTTRDRHPASPRVLHLLRGLPRQTLDDLASSLFPGDCRLCAAPLLRLSRLPLCEPCRATLQPQAVTHPGRLCEVCGEALGFESDRFLGARGVGHQVCTPCRRLPPAFARAVAFGVYTGTLRGLIGLLKFDGLRAAAAPLGHLLAEAILELAPSLDPAVETLVVPVPLFRGKARERGFNQAELLTRHALTALRRRAPGLRLRLAPQLLLRSRATESQFALNPRQRRQNLRGAFTVPADAHLAGRDLLLVDDIYTTGATARACAAVLRRAGARQVFVVTLSRAQTETVALWDHGTALPTHARGTFTTTATASDRRA